MYIYLSPSGVDPLSQRIIGHMSSSLGHILPFCTSPEQGNTLGVGWRGEWRKSAVTWAWQPLLRDQEEQESLQNPL